MKRLVNDYVEDTNDALTEKVKAYIQDTRSELESITTYNQLVSADHNGDMVITADDVFRRLTNAVIEHLRSSRHTGMRI